LIQRGRHQQGRADALDGPAADEHAAAAGQPPVAKIKVSKAEAEELRGEGLLPFTIGIDAGFTAEVSAEAQLRALGHDVLAQ
jgi:hypothetical protein